MALCGYNVFVIDVIDTSHTDYTLPLSSRKEKSQDILSLNTDRNQLFFAPITITTKKPYRIGASAKLTHRSYFGLQDEAIACHATGHKVYARGSD